ncbi:YybH family protein [Psychrobacter celer]|uniref:YybH family protein n=1 Tax=Psychrobacter celer TaxID=306572 RepID=UPI003FD0E274
MNNTKKNQQPTLGSPEASSGEATQAVNQFVEELQAGIDRRDAEIYNRHFADDVIWGSPFGETVVGYDKLHFIHKRLQQQGTGGVSRYEVVNVTSPLPDVAIAHVRRLALDDNGNPLPSSKTSESFSEMALYVLVRRNDEWWLAAGQNTIMQLISS